MADSWSLRQLCDDGACIGVIGADGRCKVCGRAARNWGDERRRGLLDEDEADRRTAKDIARRGSSKGGGGGGDFGQRRLCPDGGCIGLLDARGVCKVCGAVGTTGIEAVAIGAQAADDGADEDEAAVAEDEGAEDERDEDVDDDGARDDGDDDGDDGDDDAGDENDDGYYEDDEHAERLEDVAEAPRELCPDGSCVGLIGDDGRCKVCGRQGEARP